MRARGIGGPYALAISPARYTRIVETTEHGGYLLVDHLTRVLGGEVIWSPGLDGALLLSQRGGDFVLAVGQDWSVGYSAPRRRDRPALPGGDADVPGDRARRRDRPAGVLERMVEMIMSGSGVRRNPSCSSARRRSWAGCRGGSSRSPPKGVARRDDQAVVVRTAAARAAPASCWRAVQRVRVEAHLGAPSEELKAERDQGCGCARDASGRRHAELNGAAREVLAISYVSSPCSRCPSRVWFDQPMRCSTSRNSSCASVASALHREPEDEEPPDEQHVAADEVARVLVDRPQDGRVGELVAADQLGRRCRRRRRRSCRAPRGRARPARRPGASPRRRAGALCSA